MPEHLNTEIHEIHGEGKYIVQPNWSHQPSRGSNWMLKHWHGSSLDIESGHSRKSFHYCQLLPFIFHAWHTHTTRRDDKTHSHVNITGFLYGFFTLSNNPNPLPSIFPPSPSSFLFRFRIKRMTMLFQSRVANKIYTMRTFIFCHRNIVQMRHARHATTYSGIVCWWLMLSPWYAVIAHHSEFFGLAIFQFSHSFSFHSITVQKNPLSLPPVYYGFVNSELHYTSAFSILCLFVYYLCRNSTFWMTGYFPLRRKGSISIHFCHTVNSFIECKELHILIFSFFLFFVVGPI